MLGPIRKELGLKSSSAKKKKKASLRTDLSLFFGDRTSEAWQTAPRQFLACVGFHFPPPGILRGLKPTEVFEGQLTAKILDEELWKLLESKPGHAMLLYQFRTLEFVRMLAKIAHAQAIADFGIGCFRPFLTDLILGKTLIGSHYIGGGPPLSEGNAAHEDVLHIVRSTYALRDNVSYLVVRIKLFACFDMPRYQVVVGQLLKPFRFATELKDA